MFRNVLRQISQKCMSCNVEYLRWLSIGPSAIIKRCLASSFAVPPSGDAEAESVAFGKTVLRTVAGYRLINAHPKLVHIRRAQLVGLCFLFEIERHLKKLLGFGAFFVESRLSWFWVFSIFLLNFRILFLHPWQPEREKILKTLGVWHYPNVVYVLKGLNPLKPACFWNIRTQSKLFLTVFENRDYQDFWYYL